MTTSTRKIRVGLIGAGGIAGAHVKGYLANRDTTELVAIADPVAANAARRAEPTGAATYASYTELLQEADIDAVDICLPHHLHKDAIVAAANAGKHILCEKPLCLTEEEAREVHAAVERSGMTLMCAHNQLFSPPVAKAVELLRSGLLGEIYEVRTTDSFFNDFSPENMGWRASAATSGGGELIDTGYHPTYLMLELAGGEPVEVAAMLSTHRLRFMEGEDSAQVLVRFDNGVLGTLTTSWAYMPSSNTERFSVVGEKGSLFSDGPNLSYSLRSGERALLEFPPVDEFAAEIAHFARCLLDGTRPLHSEKEGIEVLGIILAAYESAASHAFAPVHSATSAALA
ncbi:Gfo/Idh/MocA family protein [Naasia sp. SYSU D00948]|uniref:Gfo/Idh/MocA family protein n=1 Tax=Naasia sp. SYSU D00948 TaxID=2817379 RepID=UPI001B311968|nr:Gfo/Idh/MocA family oxidoreductase [Naasia sp. SYSU D00948]